MAFDQLTLRGAKVSAAVLAALLWSAAPSLAAPDVTSANARIENGKLVIDGTTDLGNTKVRLDGKTTAGFTVTSNPTTKAFKFSVTYYPSDCVVTLQKLTGTSTLGPATNWTVNNCGSGVTPRGAWLAATQYVKDDLVTFSGSTWRAKRNSFDVTPVAGADWEVFLLRGPQGIQGPPGPVGLVAKGAWVGGSTSYAAGDLVFFNGSTWRAKRTNHDKQPDTNPSDWELLAQGGAQGPSGALAGTVVHQAACYTEADYSCVSPNCFCGAACDPGEIGVSAMFEARERSTGSMIAALSGQFQLYDNTFAIPALRGKLGAAVAVAPGSGPFETGTTNVAVTLICTPRPVPAGDPDLDGVVGAADNCPYVANPDQADTNGNGVGNACEPICGNNRVDEGEQCDDGNSTSGDGCSSACTVETGFSCPGTSSNCTTTCGDGIRAGAEQCDDANSANGDGCSASCAVEAHYICSGQPSVCAPICGDGIITVPEQCDDGNSLNGDGCSSTCHTE